MTQANLGQFESARGLMIVATAVTGYSGAGSLRRNTPRQRATMNVVDKGIGAVLTDGAGLAASVEAVTEVAALTRRKK